MNILLITSHLNLGGIGIYTSSLAKALKAKGENVFIASSGGDLVLELASQGIEHITIPINTSCDIGIHTLTSCTILSRVIKDKNINIIHAQTRVAQVIAQFLCKNNKIAFVSTCHGFFKRRFFRKIFPCWGDRIIAISDAVREHLVNDLKVPKEKVQLIYNGIDMKKFEKSYTNDDKTVLKKEYGLKQDNKIIGMISRLSPGKGHEYLLRAFKKVSLQIPGLGLLIIGDGRNQYLKDLKNLTFGLGISDDVVFYKSVKDTSMPLSIMDVFCLPTLQEGLGLSILEAMAMGVPVAASDVGGVYTLIKHKYNGLLVAPKDENALAEALRELLADPGSAALMAGRARVMVEEKFTLDIMADNVLKLYKEIVATKQAKS